MIIKGMPVTSQDPVKPFVIVINSNPVDIETLAFPYKWCNISGPN